MNPEDLIEQILDQIENPKVREWAKANPHLVPAAIVQRFLAAIEAEYHKRAQDAQDALTCPG